VRRFLLCTVSVLALTHRTNAADLPTKAPPPAAVVIPTWAGWYGGIQGGIADQIGAFGNQNLSTISDGLGPTEKASRTGGIFGINAGYNFQSGSYVYGVEGDWSWLGPRATTTAPTNCSICVDNDSFDVQWLATLRGRLGFAADATLFYITGGVAFGNVSNNASFVANNGGGIRDSITQSATRVGWTVGAGIERMLDPHWTVGAEFRYVDLGQKAGTCVPGGSSCNGVLATYRGEFSNALAIGLLKLGYKF
jgi:outer membrane immunogenic protein